MTGWALPTTERWGKTPAGYEPEPFDVVRDDGLVLIAGTSISDADVQVAWLNARRPGGHTYEVKPPVEPGVGSVGGDQ